MKKLICAKDIEILHNKGNQMILIDNQTIITPSAKDLAEDYHMTFKEKLSKRQDTLSDTQKITKEQLVSLLKNLLSEAGMSEFDDCPFDYQEHSSGVKIIRGSTIKLSPVNNTDDGVHYQEILTSEGGHFNLGILEIEASQLYEKETVETINYVIEGDLQVTIDGTIFDVNKGDIVYVPQYSAVKWSTSNKATILSGKLKSGV